MLKIFLKYAKEKWYAFLLCIPALWVSAGIFVGVAMGIASDHLPDGVTLFILTLWFLGATAIMSLPMLIITIPASQEIGLLKNEPYKKYLFIYQRIIFCVLLILLFIPFILILSMLSI